jgi:hypothetical protein
MMFNGTLLILHCLELLMERVVLIYGILLMIGKYPEFIINNLRRGRALVLINSDGIMIVLKSLLEIVSEK